MKNGSLTLNPISTTDRTRTERGYKALDMMVAALGLTVALAGFFHREITWAFVGA